MTTTSDTQNFKNLLPEQIVGACLILGFTIYTIWDQIYWWGERDDYSFGYIVPLFAAFVVYDRWPVVRSYLFNGAAPGEPSPAPSKGGVLEKLIEWAAVAAFGASLLLFAIGALLRAATGPQNPASLAIAASLGGLMLSGVFIFAKQRVDGKPMPLKQRIALTALFLFPALIWLLSAPMVTVLEKNIRVFLLMKVTVVVHNSLYFLGFDIEQMGNVLVFRRDTPDQGQVGVEEACSGIRSLTACLFAGSFLASVFLNRFWKKILLVFAAMCLAVLTNLFRSFFLTVYAYNNGSTSIEDHWVLPLVGDIGSVHDVAGYSVLVFTCIGLIMLLPIFNFRLREFDDEDPLEISEQSDV